MTTNRFCEITHELQHLSKLSEQCARIDPALYAKYDVKRGLRDINGKGVLVGLTERSGNRLISCKHCLSTFGSEMSSARSS